MVILSNEEITEMLEVSIERVLEIAEIIANSRMT